MLDRISCCLDGLKKAFLPMDGRITLMQSCLSLILTYFLLMFKVLAKVVYWIEKLQINFFWLGFGERKKRPANWVGLVGPP